MLGSQSQLRTLSPSAEADVLRGCLQASPRVLAAMPGADLPEAGERLRVPLIASGGTGSPKDGADAILEGEADAVAIATALHYGIYELEDIRTCCDAHNIKTRRIQPANWLERR